MHRQPALKIAVVDESRIHTHTGLGHYYLYCNTPVGTPGPVHGLYMTITYL